MRQPRRVLLVNELGAHLGHLRRMIPVANALRGRAASVLFALPDLDAATRVLGAGPVPFVQAPRPMPPSTPPPRLLNHADILATHGFDTADHLVALVNGWRSLFSIWPPDVIVADYAPSAVLAARTVGIPTVVIATGFEQPPDLRPSPSFRVDEDIPLARLEASEAQVLRSVNEVLGAAQLPAIDRVARIASAARVLMAGYPQTDHFGPRPGASYIGSIGDDDAGEPPVWPDDRAPRVFAYLNFDSRAQGLLQALHGLDATTLLVHRGPHAESLARQTHPRIRVTTEPVRIDDALRKADLIVSEGGHGLVCQALKAGKPMLLAPCTAEQELLAHRLGAQGLARWVMHDRFAEHFAGLLAQTIDEVRTGSAAAPRITVDADEQPVRAVLDAIAAALAV